MAKKTATKTARAQGTRKRRTSEERISDLEAQIRDVKKRASMRELKKSVSVRRLLSIVRAIDKGMAEALEEDNSPLRHALADARRAIQGYAESVGIPLPKGKMPRGRRPSMD
jgi:IS1 family transposase